MVKPHRRSRRRALLVAAVVAAGAGLGALGTGALASIEDDAVDARFALRAPQPQSEVVVVAVDDVTLDDLDLQWPLPRGLYAQAVRRLEGAGARQVVFDIQFTEPAEPEQDLALYDAIDRAGGAVMATTETDAHGATKVLGGDENLAVIDAQAAAANLENSRGEVVRRFSHSVGGLETIAVVTAGRLGRRLSADAFERAGAWIDYRGGPGMVPTVSLSKLLDGRVDPAVLRDRVVVIGASAPTLQDVHPTPTTGGGRLMAGPEIQANTIWTALHGLPLRSAPGWLDVVLVLLASSAAPLLAARFRVLHTLLAVPLLALVLALAAQGAFLAGMVVTVVPALFALAVSGLTTVGGAHHIERRERRRVAELNAQLDAEVRERTRELAEAQLEVIRRLGHAVEFRDQETGNHIERMSALCERLALAAGFDGDQAELIRHAAVMHDVGKVAVPDQILHKPGGLDDAELAAMRTHTTLGAAILAGSGAPLIQTAEKIALTHHERWDGSGYPAGLAGTDIPIEGRIASICDVFDALTSVRPYKRAWSVPEALEEIASLRGRHFDPDLVELFLAMTFDERGPEEPAVPFVAGISDDRAATDQRVAAPLVAHP